MRDATAIWFAQAIGREIRIIDYYEGSGVDLGHYVRELAAKPYVYAGHIVPHDAQAKELGTGKSRLEVLEQLGLKTITLAPMPRIRGRHQRGARLYPEMLVRCAKMRARHRRAETLPRRGGRHARRSLRRGAAQAASGARLDLARGGFDPLSRHDARWQGDAIGLPPSPRIHGARRGVIEHGGAVTCANEISTGRALGLLPPPFTGEGWGGGEQARIFLRAPSLSLQPKSDLSDFGQAALLPAPELGLARVRHLKWLKSGKPDFSWGEGASGDRASAACDAARRPDFQIRDTFTGTKMLTAQPNGCSSRGFFAVVPGLALLLLLQRGRGARMRPQQRRRARLVVVGQALPDLRHLHQHRPPVAERKGRAHFQTFGRETPIAHGRRFVV